MSASAHHLVPFISIPPYITGYHAGNALTISILQRRTYCGIPGFTITLSAIGVLSHRCGALAKRLPYSAA